MITLNARQERIVREAVDRGRFRSAEDALDQALQSIAAIPASGRDTPAAAATRLRELRKGTILPPGLTIRDLIDEGRA